KIVATLDFLPVADERPGCELVMAACSTDTQTFAMPWTAEKGPKFHTCVLAMTWTAEKGPKFHTCVVDARTGTLNRLIAHDGTLVRATFNHDATVLALLLRSEKEQWVELHDLKAKGGRRVLKTDADSLSFTSDGKRFATGGHDGTIRLWDTM